MYYKKWILDQIMVPFQSYERFGHIQHVHWSPTSLAPEMN